MRLALRALRSPRRILPRRGQRARVHIERRLEDMGIELPPVPKTQGVYQLCNQSGNLVYLAGHLPMPKGGELVKGKLGKDMSAEEGAEAARLCGLNAIATLKDYLGDLDRVKRVVKVNGFVNSTPDFTDQPKVLNGFSTLMGDVFGEKGVHSRSAVGSVSLPLGVAVEVEAIVEIEPSD